jgi:superfamily II DNA or RNA helicase
VLAVTDDDIRQVVSRNAFDAGMAYQLDGRVQEIRVSPDGGTIQALVRGSGRWPYRQSIRLSRVRNGLTIIGTCTCPVGLNCKHVAAALFAYQEEQLVNIGVDADATFGDTVATVPLARRAGQPTASPPFTSRQLAPRLEPDTPSPEITAWLNAVENAREAETEDYPASIRKRLLYVLQPGRASGGVMVDLASVELRRDGTLSDRVKRYSPYQILQPTQQPKFLRPSDRTIIRRLAALGSAPDAGEDFIDTLRRMLATGRARWGAPHGVALREGPPVSGHLMWRTFEDGAQRPDLQLPTGLQVLRLALPWYVDPGAGLLGPVELDLPPRLTRALLAAPAVAPEMVRHVGAELARRLPGVSLPSPQELAPPRVLAGPPAPHLLLFAADLPANPLERLQTRASRRPGLGGPARVPLARLLFRYGAVTMPAYGGSAATSLVDGQLYRVVRDRKAEAAAGERLRQLNFGRLGSLMPSWTQPQLHDAQVLIDPDPAAWIDFVVHEVPGLRAEGWVVEIGDDFPVRLATISGEITADIHEGSGIDWFDLELGAMVDGARVDLLPVLLEVIGRAGPGSEDLPGPLTDDDATVILPLPDGRLLPLPLDRLRPFLATILELFAGSRVDPMSGRVRLGRSSAADLALVEAASAGAGVTWNGGDALRALGRQLRAADGIPNARLPDDFAARLRPYQARGVDWLQFLLAAGLGGVLADDMGLGKTVQALAHLAIEQDAGRLDRPALVVCPTSLVANWRAEAARFAPSLRVLPLHGPERRARFAEIAAHDLVITTYALLVRDHAALVGQDWHVVILDEAQTIKNPQAGTTKLAGTLRGRQRLCLSGTPLENHLGELWSLFAFLMPGFLGDGRSFHRIYRVPIERGGDPDRRAMLARRVAPFMLRRTKADVAEDLPPKTEIVEHVEIEAAQRAIYEGIRLTMHAKVKQAVAERGLARSGIIILDALLKLRQACCDPRLLKLTTVKAAKAKSAKLDRLMEMVPELLEEDRRILLFSQFTSMLALIEQALTKAALPYVLLTGDTRDRATPIRLFQGGEVPLFLISLKAGGVGLNLTAADTVIHYDPWWNPAVEEQATDRAHRIGQDKPVFVHRLITRGTIEEKMEELKTRKQALVAGILGGGQGRALAITEQDIESLFAPVPA